MENLTKKEIAKHINTISKFCGVRDVEALTPECLSKKYGFGQVDIMVLFGGSILCGGDVLAEAIKNKVAKKYIIVGGAGHTTATLRERMSEVVPNLTAGAMTEAELYNEYLKYRYGFKADFLECESTNCGNNITLLLDLLKAENIDVKTAIFTQDSTMQRRMTAGMMKYRPDVTVINFAAYDVDVLADDDSLVYSDEIWGMWDMERYISLIMGEIPRLSDNKNGYGPSGSNYIAHVDIPENVLDSFNEMKKYYEVREANSAYATK